MPDSKSWLTPKRRATRDQRMAFGVTRRTVWRNGKRTYVYVKDGDPVEHDTWFGCVIGGFVEPPLTK